MKTQTFKAKDVKSAINLVNDEFGEKAIILSTKKNNGFVEIEASDNEKIITDHKRKKKTKIVFQSIFQSFRFQKINNSSLKDNISYLNRGKNNETSKDSSNELFEKLNENIDSMRKEINNMILTDQSGISDQLSYLTPIKLRQENFRLRLLTN